MPDFVFGDIEQDNGSGRVIAFSEGFENGSFFADPTSDGAENEGSTGEFLVIEIGNDEALEFFGGSEYAGIANIGGSLDMVVGAVLSSGTDDIATA